MNKLKITIFISKKSSYYQIFADFGNIILTILSNERCWCSLYNFFSPQNRILPVYKAWPRQTCRLFKLKLKSCLNFKSCLNLKSCLNNKSCLKLKGSPRQTCRWLQSLRGRRALAKPAAAPSRCPGGGLRTARSLLQYFIKVTFTVIIACQI